jgi:hypothetical protein
MGALRVKVLRRIDCNARWEQIMVESDGATSRAQFDQLAREIDEAELFVQKLHAYIVTIRDELAAGHTGRALSICNEALSEIDSATDVVASSPADHAPPRA